MIPICLLLKRQGMEERLHSYFQGESGHEERLKLLREIESDRELRRQFIEMKNFYSLIHFAVREENEVKEGRKSYNRFIQKIHRRRTGQYLAKAIGYAAAVATIVLSTYFVTINRTEGAGEKLLSLHVPAGQRLKLTLEDGTSVWLNSRSTLHYPASFAKDQRRVEIEGEAYFEVAGEAGRPFIVSSDEYEMEVLGTTFNVSGYPETGYVRTSLIEGSLMVYNGKNKAENIILKPSQQVTIEDGRMKVERIPDKGYFLWTEGIYSFNNEPLDNILRKLELYFDIEIIVNDPSIYSWEYTGKFRQRDGIDEILKVINKIHKFKIKKDEDNNRIILSK